MPSLDTLTASTVVKLLYLGDSKSGKTGSLASLVAEGYIIRMIDMDNGWESLAAAIQRSCPQLLGNVDVESHRDKYKSSPTGPILAGQPKAFINSIKLLDKWSDGTIPATWGPQYILVLDSLSFFAVATFAWQEAMNPSAGQKGGTHPETLYGNAQKAIEHVLALLTGPDFNTNVIIIGHIDYSDMIDGTTKGFPRAVGKKLSPKIPTYFNSVAQCLTKPGGGNRIIQTRSTPFLELANPKSFEMEASYPIETGLATFFEKLRGAPTWTNNQTKSPIASSVLATSPTGTTTSPTPAASIQRITPKPSPISLK